MKKLILSKDHFDKDNKYIGEVDVSNFTGFIEIESSLGTVFFKKLCVTGYIFAKAGTGIEAGQGIEAGWGIEAGNGIKVGTGIKTGNGIEAGWGK